ncbi:hypothetical protein [Dialister hominis]|uniref:hypothetical protein n=1 Tax=Dialister hominis TaxID=2582419 RepID=UPI00352148AD
MMTVSLRDFFIRPVGTVIFAALILALLFVVRNNEARALFAERFGERGTDD